MTIKNLPSELHAELKKEASADGRSLNSFVLAILAAATEERARLRRMRANRDELEAFVASLPASENAVELIREDREAR